MAQKDSKSTSGQNKGFDQNKKAYSQNPSDKKSQTPQKPERWSEDSDEISEQDENDARSPSKGSREY